MDRLRHRRGPRRLELSAAIALGLPVLVLCVNWLRSQSPKLLEFSDVGLATPDAAPTAER